MSEDQPCPRYCPRCKYPIAPDLKADKVEREVLEWAVQKLVNIVRDHGLDDRARGLWEDLLTKAFELDGGQRDETWQRVNNAVIHRNRG